MRASEDHRRLDMPWAGQPPGPITAWHAAHTAPAHHGHTPTLMTGSPLGPQKIAGAEGAGPDFTILAFNPQLRARRPDTKG